jgi:hypothetical protein
MFGAIEACADAALIHLTSSKHKWSLAWSFSIGSRNDQTLEINVYRTTHIIRRPKFHLRCLVILGAHMRESR